MDFVLKGMALNKGVELDYQITIVDNLGNTLVSGIYTTA